MVDHRAWASMANLEISRLCRKPDVFSGIREKWCDFRMDMTNYMAASAGSSG